MEKDRRFILCGILIAVMLLVFDVSVMGQFQQQPVSFGLRIGKGGVRITAKAAIAPSIPTPGLAGGPSYVKTGTVNYSWHSKTIHAKTDVTTQSIIHAINPKKEPETPGLSKAASFNKYIPTTKLDIELAKKPVLHEVGYGNPNINLHLNNIDVLTDSLSNIAPDEIDKVEE